MTPYGQTADGRPVHRIRLGGDGIVVDAITYGARLAAITVPTPGGPRQVLLSRGDMAGWEADRAYLGATVGRFAGRIEGARFTLDGREHHLPANDGDACLHGGTPGFECAVWQAEHDGDAVLLRHTSPAGDQGFPGTLQVSVRFAVEDAMALAIDYTATTDAPTVLNLTNHAYFNLAGAGTIHDHMLQIASESFIPVGPGLIQNAPPRPVAGSVFDFRTPRRIGDGLAATDEQIAVAGGYDHTWLLAPATPAARLSCAGITMEVTTTEPSLQLYTGNFLDSPRHAALSLETQHVPNTPNRPEFPSTTLRPGRVFRSRTVYRFSA